MAKSLIDREKEVFFQTYKRLPIEVDKAVACKIYDKQGNVYTDFLSGIAVNALGHSHPKIIEAVNTQVSKYMHLSNYFYQELQIKLAEKIKEVSGYDRIFFSNSGSEAMEGALKLIRRWGNMNQKTKIVAFSGGFHGRTFGALSIMDKPLYKDNMGPFLDNMVISKYNDVKALEEVIDSGVSAVVLEFLQGEGGITMASKEFVDKIFELKEKFGFLVVADEIQAGAGRTGKFFCFEHLNVKPDIITVAKGFGGGLPLGAIITTEKLAEIFKQGMHGTTFGGNSVACACGLVVVEELQNGLLTHVTKVGKYMHEQLEKLRTEFPDKILEVRGIGLMQGLLLSFDAWNLVLALLEQKIITNAASGTVLRLVPPLVVTEAEVDELTSALKKCLK